MTSLIHAIGSAVVKSLFDPADRTTTANGSAVDISEYEGSILAILTSEAGGGTTPTLDVKLQESADGSTGWTDISGATFTQVTDAAAAIEGIQVDANAAKQYIRAVATISGTSPSFDSAVVIAGLPKYR